MRARGVKRQEASGVDHRGVARCPHRAHGRRHQAAVRQVRLEGARGGAGANCGAEGCEGPELGEIDLPGLKQTLWHNMRQDLTGIVPWFADNGLLLCPTCCRALPYDGFSIEHIIPQQALADDPQEVKTAISKIDRSGITLLCKKTLVFKNKTIHGHGCNSWKGKHYDRYIREALQPNALGKTFHSRHHVALFCATFLGLFRSYGYQVVLAESGRLMRKQFFSPNHILQDLPFGSQMTLFSENTPIFNEDSKQYWKVPFKFHIEHDAAIVVARNFSIRLPLSRDLRLPVARHLNYVPPRYRFRPDLQTAFD